MDCALDFTQLGSNFPCPRQVLLLGEHGNFPEAAWETRTRTAYGESVWKSTAPVQTRQAAWQAARNCRPLRLLEKIGQQAVH